jgi:hypothetical protein
MPNEGGFAGHPKKRIRFFWGPRSRPYKNHHVVPLRGLGLGCGLLVCDCPAAKRVLDHGTTIQ